MADSTYFDPLGEDLEPGGRQAAPPPLRVVQQFINTYNHELGHERDRLGSLVRAKRWLIDHDLLGPEALSDQDVQRLIEFREALRALIVGRSTDRLVETACVRFRLDEHRLHIEAQGGGVDRTITALLLVIHAAMIDGSWQRVKACRQCEWVFFDHSRNRSGGWCSMAVCGNRAKIRSYRQRASS